MSGMDPKNYPFWRIRKNQSRGWLPADDLFLMRVDANGAPSATGQSRMFGCRAGYVYEYDAPSVYTDADPTDTTVAFSMKIRRDGYDGYNDGVREFTKSNRHLFIRTTRVNGTLTATLYSDGGDRSGKALISPSGGSSFWGDGGDWGDGGNWTAGEFATTRGELAGKGKKFDLELDDEGDIASQFSLNSWSLTGFVDEEM